jgi:hypothetical protein
MKTKEEDKRIDESKKEKRGRKEGMEGEREI